jgi:hypothetical protein
LGTGFVIDSEVIIETNDHIVEAFTGFGARPTSKTSAKPASLSCKSSRATQYFQLLMNIYFLSLGIIVAVMELFANLRFRS